jgi:hypothetical protein
MTGPWCSIEARSSGIASARGQERRLPERKSIRTKEPAVYARVVIYSYDEDKTQLEAKARAAVIPIVTNTSGYISYGVMFDDAQVVSISQWDSEEHAKAADAALIEWVTANTTMKPVSRYDGELAWLEIASAQVAA